MITRLNDYANEKLRKDLTRGLPQSIYNSVWEENAHFLRDRTLYDISYFDFIFNIIHLGNFPNCFDYSEDFNLMGEGIFYFIIFYYFLFFYYLSFYCLFFFIIIYFIIYCLLIFIIISFIKLFSF